MKDKTKSKNESKNKTLSEDLLNSYRAALYKVRDFFLSIEDREFDVDNIEQSMKIIKSILDSGASLGKNIETLAILEKKVAAEEAVNSKVRGGAKLGMWEDGNE